MITKITLIVTLLCGMAFSDTAAANDDGFIGIQIGSIRIGIGGSHKHYHGCEHFVTYHTYSARKRNPRYYYAQPQNGHVDIIENGNGDVYVMEHETAYNHRGQAVEYYNNPNNNIELVNGIPHKIPKSSWKYVHPMPGSKFKPSKY